MTTTFTVPTVTIDMNDAAFLAALVREYIAKDSSNNNDYLWSLHDKLNPTINC